MCHADTHVLAVCVCIQVCNYCSSKLAELGLPVLTWAVGWTDGSQVPPDADGKKYLELMCNNMVSEG